MSSETEVEIYDTNCIKNKVVFTYFNIKNSVFFFSIFKNLICFRSFKVYIIILFEHTTNVESFIFVILQVKINYLKLCYLYVIVAIETLTLNFDFP